MKADLRKKLLKHFSALASDAESSDEPNVFLPVSLHARALQPQIVVIAGGRGAGKSELFKALKNFGPKLKDLYGTEIPTGTWVDAFSTTSVDHPQIAVLDEQAARMDDTELRAWWLHRLAVRLADFGDPQLKPGATPAVAKDGAFVDSVERSLASKKAYVFAAYDYLDHIGNLDRRIRRRYVKALLSLWVPLSARYTWVRPKVFLRPDLIEDGQQDFPDASKLQARTQSLQWSPDDLFRLTCRHLANRGPAVKEALEWLRVTAKVQFTKGAFGQMPQEFTEDARADFAKALAGEVMGRGHRKGFTYRWITNHLQDGGGRIAPRSILRLFGFAAQRPDTGNQSTILVPEDLQGALEETSKARANELIEEHPLVSRLESLRGRQLLLERNEAERLLAKRSGNPADIGTEDGRQAFAELERLGVVSVRADGRIDVPDILRSGFGILRKGGTRRAR